MQTLSIIIGAIGTILGIISFQTKKQTAFIFAQLGANFMAATSFVLLGTDRIAGGLLCFAAIFQSALNYVLMKRGLQPPKWTLAVFFVVYACVTLIPVFAEGNIRFPYSFCPFFSSVMFLFSISAKEGKVSRRFALVNSVSWLLYDILGDTFPWSNFATHVCMAGSILIGMYRYDLPRSRRKEQEKSDSIE